MCATHCSAHVIEHLMAGEWCCLRLGPRPGQTVEVERMARVQREGGGGGGGGGGIR